MNRAEPISTGDRPRVKALILAAGLGTRLRPITDRIPKCLVPIGGRPLLDYWFDALERAGIRDVLINTHHLAEQVRDYVDTRNSQGTFHTEETFEPELLGSAGTVSANRTWMEDADHCAVIYSDNLSNVNLGEMLRFHLSHGDPLTMMLFRVAEPRKAGIVGLGGNDRVVSFEEKPEDPRSDLANAGVYLLTAEAWREVADLGAFDFGFDVLPRFVGRMSGYFPDAYHRDIGSAEALAAAERELGQAFGGGSEEPVPAPAVFLDRDGTLIEHVHHLTDPEDVKLIPGAAEAVVKLRNAGYRVVLVTNQSVVGRGMLSEEGLERVHSRVCQELAARGAGLDAIYWCPEVPGGGDAETVEHPARKPGPGMILRAQRELGLDLSRSWMVGDTLSDLLAGKNAECVGTVLVRTGLGLSVDADHPAVQREVPDLLSAADLISAERRQTGSEGGSCDLRRCVE